MAWCKACGGTGDQWDEETDYWVIPMTKCLNCNGWGEVDDPEENA